MPASTPIQEFLDLPLPMQATVIVLGLAAVQQFRQEHMGRVAIASAAAIVIGVAYPAWGSFSEIWQLYALVAVGFGGIAGISYLTKTSLPTEFYKIALLLYGGLPLILVILYGFPL